MSDKTKVYNMDCLVGMRETPDKFYELAIIDCPYGLERFNKNVESKSRSTFKNKLCDWDEIPKEEYFKELFRVSINQIIWGANHFWKVSDTYSLPNCPHFIFWDKKQPVGNFSDGELAWTSFDGVGRKFIYAYYGNIEGNSQGNGRIHPTQKPVALYKWLLKNYAKEGDKILDTHLGSQSSRIAAFDMGFDFTGYELDKDYFEAGCKRFNQHKAQLKLFV